MITVQQGQMVPLPFGSFADPATGRPRIREVNLKSGSYRVATEYMIRLERRGPGRPGEARCDRRRRADDAGLPSVARFGYLVEARAAALA